MRESPISCAPTKYRPTPNQRKGWVGCSTANMHADPCSDAHGRAGPNPYRVAGGAGREKGWGGGGGGAQKKQPEKAPQPPPRAPQKTWAHLHPHGSRGG